MPTIYNKIPRNDISLGVILAENIDPQVYPPAFDQELRTLLKERGQELTAEEEALRREVRDMLRNGRYKPTGRGKPASEYLVRRAREVQGESVPHDAFPRISAPVDCCNFISLQFLLPISLWDLERAGEDHYVFRLGRPGESYVFNEGGQPIDLEDLVVGCRSEGPDEAGEPIVNPVKDSMTTKAVDETRHVASVIYAPASFAPDRLQTACEQFAAMLAGCGVDAVVRFGLVAPHGSLDL